MTASARPSRARAALFVLFAGAAFSIASPLARYARPLDPFVIALGRLLVATVILGAIDPREVVTSWRSLRPRARGLVLTAGAILAAHFACFLWGLDHTSLTAAVSLVSLEPVSVVLIAWATLGAHMMPRRGEVLGVAVATAGAVVVARGAGQGEHRLVGDLAVIGAVVLYGLYLAVARAVADAIPARSYAVLVYATAALTMTPLLVAERSFTGEGAPPAWTGTPGLVAIVGLGLVPTVLGHTAVQTASRSLPPSVVGLVSPMETLGGILIGTLWMGDAPSAQDLTGAAVILVGTAATIVAHQAHQAHHASAPVSSRSPS